MSTTNFYKNGALVAELDFVEPNLNLLAHAQTIELEVGSRCGGHGKCGGDRILVRPDSQCALSEVTEAERKHLTVLEIAQGYRLACQCFPNDAQGTLKLEVFP